MNIFLCHNSPNSGKSSLSFVLSLQPYPSPLLQHLKMSESYIIDVLIIGDSRMKLLERDLNSTLLNFNFTVISLPGAQLHHITLKALTSLFIIFFRAWLPHRPTGPNRWLSLRLSSLVARRQLDSLVPLPLILAPVICLEAMSVIEK